MINTTLNFLANNLNAYLKSNFQIDEDLAIVSNLINADGSVPNAINNKIVICLTNIEQENSLSNLGYYNTNNNPIELNKQPININLYILIAANFSNYNESLKFISTIFNFFHENNVFFATKYPELDSTIDKLVLELFKTDVNTNNKIWNAIGAKYSPSLNYKARLLAAQNASASIKPLINQ